MNSKLNQRWLIVGAIWLAVLVMTWQNFGTIDAVLRMRENAERLCKEVEFQYRNSDTLQKIGKLHAAQFKPVASVKLGFESVRSSVQALAALLGLENIHIESQMAQATEAQLPFIIRTQGASDRALGLVTALATYPYLSVRHSRIVVHSTAADAEIEIEILLNFKIEPQEDTASNPLQASSGTSARGDRRK
jgi:hypothetical protein